MSRYSVWTLQLKRNRFGDERRTFSKPRLNFRSLTQIIAGNDTFFTFDYVFGVDTQQSKIYQECVTELVDGNVLYSVLTRHYLTPMFSMGAAFFEGFNATILAYGQTGSCFVFELVRTCHLTGVFL